MRRPHVPDPVFITGLGAVTGYGWGIPALEDGLRSGVSAVTYTDGLDGFVDGGFAYLALIPDEGDPEDGTTRYMRALRAAARETVLDARSRGWSPAGEVGVVFTAGTNDAEQWGDFFAAGVAKIRPRKFLSMLYSTGPVRVMREFGFHGPVVLLHSMCSSGNSAMLTAQSWIDSGLCSDVLVLTADLSGYPMLIRPFSDLGACVLNRPPFDGSRPFQEGSRGFVGGEAAVGLLVSQNPEGSYGSMLGGAFTGDGYHEIALDPDGGQVRRCYQMALARSGVDASDVMYMNAHGPGTAACDSTEGALFDELFPGAVGIYSIKPLVGHCQMAATHVELAALMLSFASGVISAPPQVAPGLRRLLCGQVTAPAGITLKSALGMGGSNTALLLAPPAA